MKLPISGLNKEIIRIRADKIY
ncbi:hypothetical protein FOXB_06738 [Fusarium oxysporum f. sp. conglutinans Fo5176]|uniref:Uncharacterized protein n=1 Tax=Fusarium oxysporum (strain Fo5176) TaxID=660025 RepID=F9FK09_FUSOF|nr:hypothetical protein FOXB_06738 [Fusarium oxysporum f. sp. conglutinans Fo5176]